MSTERSRSRAGISGTGGSGVGTGLSTGGGLFDDDIDAPQVDEVLFAALRACRLGLAREQAVPPYVIFHDKTLLAMAARRPTTTAALGGISGVGDVKLARYGEAFLDVIRGHVDGDGGADLPAASHVAGDDGGLLDIA